MKKAKEPDCALCTTRKKVFRIDGGGIFQVKSHQKSKTHKEKESVYPNQRTFVVVGSKNNISLSSGKLSLTTEQLIQIAETVQALKFVDANYSFASASNDTDRFKFMFPDSKVVNKAWFTLGDYGDYFWF